MRSICTNSALFFTNNSQSRHLMLKKRRKEKACSFCLWCLFGRCFQKATPSWQRIIRCSFMHLSLSLDVPHLWLWEKDELHIRKTLYYKHLYCMIYESTLPAPKTKKKKFHQVALQMFFMFVSHQPAQAGACCLSEPYEPGMPILGALLKMICWCRWGPWMALLS